MTGRATDASDDGGAWSALSRRFAPYLDVTVGVLAAGLSLASALATDVEAIDPRLEPADVVSVTATLVAGLALVWRRTRPVASFCVFVAACLVVTLTDHYIGLLSVILLFSLYSLAAHGVRRLHGVVGLAACIVVFLGLALLDVPDLGTSDLVQAWALLLAAWALGDALRSRRAQQAQRLRVAEQEAVNAREHAARAVAEERLRIARELHDVVAHSMSLIAVQAGVGGHVIRTDVAAAEHALEVIGDTSRDALTQTRSMLGLLREEGSASTDPPSQSMTDLDALLEGFREAGVDVTLTTKGPPRTLATGVQLTAYRIVQESLTNVLKHSGAMHAAVGLHYVADGIDIDVSDTGGSGGRPRPATAPPTSGHGLTGLHERTRLLGGDLEYGVRGDGFRVHAHLPDVVPAAP